MSADKKKRSFLDSFRIEDMESCASAIRNGGIAALISAAITAIFSIIGFFTSSSDATLNYFLDPWSLFDVALIIVLAIFIFRKSRVASTLMLIYFVVSKVVIWLELGKPKGLVMTLIFFAYYVTAMRATYIWHSLYRDLNSERTMPNNANSADAKSRRAPRSVE